MRWAIEKVQRVQLGRFYRTSAMSKMTTARLSNISEAPITIEKCAFSNTSPCLAFLSFSHNLHSAPTPSPHFCHTLTIYPIKLIFLTNAEAPGLTIDWRFVVRKSQLISFIINKNLKIVLFLGHGNLKLILFIDGNLQLMLDDDYLGAGVCCIYFHARSAAKSEGSDDADDDHMMMMVIMLLMMMIMFLSI